MSCTALIDLMIAVPLFIFDLKQRANAFFAFEERGLSDFFYSVFILSPSREQEDYL